MNIQAVIVNGQQVIPKVELDLQNSRAVGIQTNVRRKNMLLDQLTGRSDTYIAYAEQGAYERLTVGEMIGFLKNISDYPETVSSLLHQFQLDSLRKTRIADLPSSKKSYLALIAVFFAHQPTIVLEEPYFRLEEQDRFVFSELLEQLAARKKIVILTANLEDALISCDEIYRLDDGGVHQLDIADAPEERGESIEESGETSFKIQKIPTKSNDKVILFNPPEIDYIESINSLAVVHVGGEAYDCAMTLAELEERLRHYGFFRCHRSYIVNLQKVRELITWTKNSYSLRLSTGKDSVVPLSRTKLAELKALLNI